MARVNLADPSVRARWIADLQAHVADLMLVHALSYAARGWRVLRLAPADKVPLSRSAGVRAATADAGKVQSLWLRAPRCNIGIATGRRSGVIVIDVDAGKGGVETMRAIQASHGALPRTLTARTGAGWHLYFAAPSTPIRSAANVLGPGVDTRGEGGYVVAPPSVHPSGAVYRWINQEPLAALPSWAVDLAGPRPEAAPSRATGAHMVDVPVDVLTRARRWLARCEPAIQGSNGSAATMHDDYPRT